jgi:hypothetical protein
VYGLSAKDEKAELLKYIADKSHGAFCFKIDILLNIQNKYELKIRSTRKKEGRKGTFLFLPLPPLQTHILLRNYL